MESSQPMLREQAKQRVGSNAKASVTRLEGDLEKRRKRQDPFSPLPSRRLILVSFPSIQQVPFPPASTPSLVSLPYNCNRQVFRYPKGNFLASSKQGDDASLLELS